MPSSFVLAQRQLGSQQQCRETSGRQEDLFPGSETLA
jgi:hypothetical protein